MHNQTPSGMKPGKCEEVDWYRFFAYLISPPSRERFGRISQPGLQKTIADLWEGMGCTGDVPRTAIFETFEHYEACYIATFDVGAPEPPVPLLESFYHKEIPPQQTLLENICFYEVVKLRIDAALGSPDHLVAQLEFCAAVRYLEDSGNGEKQRQDLRRLERDFLERHLLSWLPTVVAKLQKLAPPVFPAWFSVLLQYVRYRLEELADTVAQPGAASISSIC